CLQGCSPPYSF
nr:immunoglobulin light chain junction region [Macaca mulatta]